MPRIWHWNSEPLICCLCGWRLSIYSWDCWLHGGLATLVMPSLQASPTCKCFPSPPSIVTEILLPNHKDWVGFKEVECVDQGSVKFSFQAVIAISPELGADGYLGFYFTLDWNLIDLILISIFISLNLCMNICSLSVRQKGNESMHLGSFS